MHGLRRIIKEDVLPLSDHPKFEALAEVAKRGLLAPETWHCNRPHINLKTTIDVPLLGPLSNRTETLRAAEEWERCICENQAFSILHQAQEGRQELIKKDGGEMLVSIVLDRPLDEVKALVEDTDSSRKLRQYLKANKHIHC